MDPGIKTLHKHIQNGLICMLKDDIKGKIHDYNW